MPAFRRINKAVVQGRLGGEKIYRAAAVTVRNPPNAAGNILNSLKGIPDIVVPYIAVRKFIGLGLH